MVRHSATVFYPRYFDITEYTLNICSSADNSLTMTRDGAQKACTAYNSTLVQDVLNSETQNDVYKIKIVIDC
jgi:hypothetical protein